MRARPTEEADNVEDCDGEARSALVDVVGDEDRRRSVTIDFEAERQRKAATAIRNRPAMMERPAPTSAAALRLWCRLPPARAA